ncbi:protein gp37 [Kineothrix alysoides]|uniref:Protein gp37 n=2 Tax=Kineothrix alysoides TaxID=1469948 RepID=A0A4R1R534_9FIRM|nr:protein gp37 [Kineothrix alysoides]
MTWNPVTGCTKLSDGCENCYAARMAKRLKAMGNPRYINEFEVTVHRDLFNMPLTVRKPRMIFVNSMSDLFHSSVSDRDIIEIFNTMNAAQWHTFQVLTKRPDRLLRMDQAGLLNWTQNIWMGTTVENDKYLERINCLRQTNSATKFLSCEPLLGSLATMSLQNIDWVIVGGESGPNSREIKKEWVIEIRDLCKKEGVPFFFKQWGGRNKKKSGRVLDEKTYDEYPL